MKIVFTSPHCSIRQSKRSVLIRRILLATMLLALLVGVLPLSTAAAVFYPPSVEEAVSPPARSMQSATRSKMDADVSMVVAQTTSLEVTPTVSECYYTAGQSKRTISVEVSWSGLANPSTITVTLATGSGNQTRTIAASTTSNPPIVTPQVVAFEVSSSFSGTISATSGSSSSSSVSVEGTGSCDPLICGANDTGGTVFTDLDGDGIQDAGELVGVSGVTVKGYDNAGQVHTAVTDKGGRYCLAIPPASYPVRSEFTGLPTGTEKFGTNIKSTVQFLTQPSSSLDLGLSNQANYCQNDPWVLTPSFVFGNPLQGAEWSSLQRVRYMTGGVRTGMQSVASAKEIGAVWGLAYKRQTGHLFAAATLRRHSGSGPKGLGGIYVIDPKPGSSTTTATGNVLDSWSVVDLGVTVAGGAPLTGDGATSNVARGLPGDRTSPSRDVAAFAGIGKVGLGDIDISDDGNRLFFVNYYDKKLYSVDLSGYDPTNPATRPTSANLLSKLSLGNCTGGEWRPSGLKVRDGSIYLGGVCDGSSGTRSDLRAKIYKINIEAADWTTQSWDTVLDFPLTYPKGIPHPVYGGNWGRMWNRWTDNFSDLVQTNTTTRAIAYPVPILSDIEFDIDGSMILGFNDRTGMQTGLENLSTDSGDSALYQTNAIGGDILRAFPSGNTYVLENQGRVGGVTGYSATNNEGPGFGEFYDDTYGSTHFEISFGALAVLPGSGEVALTALDPLDGGPFYAGGIRYLSNLDGRPKRAFVMYGVNTGDPAWNELGKSTGLGDLELLCDTVNYLEIGNRVWADLDFDGVQDPSEPGIAGVQVTLYKNGVQVGSPVTTDSAGNYLFNSGLEANTAYEVRISQSQMATLGYPGLTTANAAQGGAPDADIRDSDAVLTSGNAVIQVTTGTGQVSHTLDFGFTLPAQFGDRVWVESDTDGLANTGVITPVAGMGITATGANGTVYTTTTNAQGYYSFTVAAGTYTVTYGSVPSSYGAVVPSATPGGSSESGSEGSYQQGPDRSHQNHMTVTVGPGEANWGVDFGFTPPAQFGDRVWVESDTDGLANTGVITPVAGMGITATGANGTVYTAVTNAQGYYSFTVPAGTYTVTYGSVPSSYGTVFPSATPGGGSESGNEGSYQQGPDQSHQNNMTVTVGAGEANWSIDFAFYLPAQFGDRVWIESDTDGLANTGVITPVAGMVLTATSGSTVYTATTNAQGYYSFTVPAGTYTVVYGSVPSSYGTVFPSATPGGGSESGNEGSYQQGPDQSHQNNMTVTVGAGEANWSIDFAFNLPAQFGDRAWIESDTDGLASTGVLTPVAGMVITATGGSIVYTTTTNAQGYYSFTVPGGTYTVTYGSVPSSYGNVVRSSTPGGSSESGNAGSYQQSGNPDQSHQNNTTVTVGAGEANWKVDFAFNLLPVSIGNYVWYDSDQDGVQDAAESGVPGVTVKLLDDSGAVVATTTTDADGYYLFANLAAGNYSLEFVPPAGYLISPQDAGGNDAADSDVDPATRRTPETTLTAGGTDRTWDLGLYLPVQPASLGDRVWYDTDKDGVQDANETGVSGVTVKLLDAGGTVVGETQTGFDGYYAFANLVPEDYAVQFVPPAGYTISPQDIGTNDAADSDAAPVTGKTVTTVLVAGENDPSWDLGLSLPVEPASLGDTVWYDSNRNGVQDPGEIGVPGVTVQLYSAAGVLIAEQVTDAEGKHLFTNLTPGDYQVKFIPPAGYQLSPQVEIADFADSDAVPQTGWSHVVNLSAGELDPTVDAGLYLPEPPAAIGDRVWYDTDRDGVQDPGEAGVPGVTVTLYRENGSTVARQRTGADGLYHFENLASGNYFVGFAPPAAYTITDQDALGETGNDQTNGGATDSDANPMTGLTAVTTLMASEQDLTWDLGLYLPVEPASLGDYVWMDLDADGVQEEGEPPLQGVVTTLYSAEGAPLATTTTDTKGAYRFDALPPGSYSVGFAPPASYAPTTADSGSDNAADSDADPVTGRTLPVTLSAGEHNPTLDAGFVPQLSLGNFVFNDFRNNGIFDAGEDYGIDGIALNLYRYEADGTLTSLESTVTADGGHYLFTDLLPGDYVVELDEQNFALGAKLNQFVSSSYTRDDPSAEPRIDPDTDINNDDNGFSIELPSGGRAIRNQPVTLDYGAEPVNDEDLNPTSNLSVDFGVYDPALGDRIWYDLNRDGIQDAGELGVAGVTLELYIDTNSNNVWDPGDPLLRTTTTNDEGYYRFTFLPPGDYIVRIPPENFGVAGPLYTWNLSPGGADPDTDLNTDSNGLEDGQGGVVALAVTLTSGAEPVDDGDTDEFTNLSVDFGVWRSAASGDRVWYDTDEDGFQDANESGVPGVTAQLYNAQGNLVAEQKTDTNGNYLFENLEPASYSIKFVPPAGYLISPQDAGGTNGNDQYANGGTDDSDVDPATGQTVVTSLGVGETDRTWDLGIYLAEPPATIGDRVWYDTDRDGIQDVGESGVAGVTVQLLNASGAVVATTATNKNGSYLFENLPPGNYAVQFVPPAGYTISPQNAGNTPALDSDVDPATGRTAATPLQTGETDRTWDLGIYLPTEPAAIGERVWFDTHRDGIQNADEKGVAGVIVQLYTAGGVLVAEQRTDGRGDYLFQNLPAGDYYVQFIPPARYSISPQDAEGTNGNDQSSNGGATDSDVDPATRRTVATNLQPGETDRTWDLGIYLAVEPASLGDRVWYDTDKDGVQDYNESGVVGVVVQLYDAAGTLVAETVTDAVGNYRFDNLAPGDYYVRFVPPAGYSISPQAVGSNAAADSDADPNTGKTVLTNLVAQENDPTWDLGIYTQQPPASLGDLVWYDTDKNGVQDAGETGVPGVVVQLYSAAGASVAETRTDANGNYRFENLVPGDYSVQFVPHPAYTVSPQDAGADDGADSDVNPLSGQTVVTNLQAGENDPTWDLGISLDVEPASVSDRVWFDTNRNGVQDPGEAGVAGVGVRLYNEFGNLVAETVADANGGYQFVNLPPGTYQLRFGTRSGYTITNPGTGTGADSDVDPLTGLTAPIVLDPGENDSTWDLGLHLQNTLPASLGDLVWFDEDQDGVQDAAEARVADVMVRLYDAASSLVAQTATDANGNYLFRSLVPGVYFVQFVPPPNYTVTGQNRGAIEEDSDGDSVTGITVPTTLDAGENDLTWDLGIYLVPTALPEGVEPELPRFLYLPVVGNRSGSAVSDVPAAQVGGQSVREESSVVPDAILEENNPTAPAATPVPDFLNQNREPAQQFEIETSAP